ncbi:MAG TPA: hypothetical protein VFC64_02650 [Atopostipes sp.]|nr:hypothetical protein [Atopostipes sp.]
MNLDYDIKKLSNQHRIEQRKRDNMMTEHFQRYFEALETIDETRLADTIDWVLELVDRLEEAGYEYEQLEEENRELKQYIENWQVRPNLGKHFYERF